MTPLSNQFTKNNFDRHFYYAIANLRPLAGSASKYLRSLQAFDLGQLWVHSGFALCLLWVRPSEPRVNVLGPLWVRFLLGCVRSVLYLQVCDFLYIGFN
jgi:hypothetical protein